MRSVHLIRPMQCPAGTQSPGSLQRSVAGQVPPCVKLPQQLIPKLLPTAAKALLSCLHGLPASSSFVQFSEHEVFSPPRSFFLSSQETFPQDADGQVGGEPCRTAAKTAEGPTQQTRQEQRTSYSSGSAERRQEGQQTGVIPRRPAWMTD